MYPPRFRQTNIGSQVVRESQMGPQGNGDEGIGEEKGKEGGRYEDCL
jgi:hypothetical protein